MMRRRGFEVVKKYKKSELNLPNRMTKNSAGYDIESAEDVTIEPGEIKLIPTGIKAFMMNDEVLFLYDRSSNPRKLGCVLVNSVGVIDSDYYNNLDNEGEIFVQFKNISAEKVLIKKGMRIAQAVFMKYLISDDDENFMKDDRIGGIGSTNN